jgi:hypothetical protein
MKKHLSPQRMLSPVLNLYPKNFRDIYAEQIELTLQDILSSRSHRNKIYALCASLTEIAIVGIQLNIKEWATMSKKLSMVTASVVAVGIFVLASSIYLAAQASCALPGQCRTAGVYGVHLTYPKEWSAQKEQFFVTQSTRATGLTVASPKSVVRVAIAAQYTGKTGPEAGLPVASGLQGKLISQDPLSRLANTNVIKWIQYDNTTKTYIALENIVSTDQLKQLGFVLGKFTPLATSPQLLFKTVSAGRELSAGFNSQGPLSLEQANAWFNGKDAAIAHKMLLSLSTDNV